ncbi:MAG: glycosyltransferase family 4 protein [Candidatus Firestonebacteria bacterium]|nr:glycosyltransferase family 4 protein [Candidatus Firestonebacteria bacterium]
MRIALIARGCRHGAGIERYTYEIARRLSERHEVAVLTQPQEFEACGQARLVPVRIPPAPHWHSILNFSHKAGFMAQSGHYDVVHTQGSDATWGDVVTAHSCHAAGMRASLKFHPTLANRVRKLLSPAHRAILSLEIATLVSAREILPVSERVKRQVWATYPTTARTPTEVIYPGVGEDHFLSTGQYRELRATTRIRLGIEDHQVVFALVANALRLKGGARLIQALACMQHTEGVLLLASSTLPDESLKSLAARLGVSRRVHFLALHHLPHAALAAADAYVLLPEYESFGLTVLEAAAAGLPLVLAQNAGAAELFRPGHDALLLPALSRGEVVARLLDNLAARPVWRHRLGAAARRVARKHSWDQTTKALEKIYQQVHLRRRTMTGREV